MHISISLGFTLLFITHNYNLVLAKVLALATAELGLDNKRTTVNGIDDRVPTGEGVVRPCTSIPDCLTAARNRIVTGEDVKVGDFCISY